MQRLFLRQFILRDSDARGTREHFVTGLFQSFERSGVHKFVFQGDDVAAFGEFHQCGRVAPVADDGIRREPGGGTEWIFFQHHDFTTERQRGNRRHARQLSAADDAEPHRKTFRRSQLLNF